jgi:hypothetical protein
MHRTSRKCLHSVHIGVANNVIGLSCTITSFGSLSILIARPSRRKIRRPRQLVRRSTDQEYEVSQMRGDANPLLRGFFIERMSIGQQVLP